MASGRLNRPFGVWCLLKSSVEYKIIQCRRERVLYISAKANPIPVSGSGKGSLGRPPVARLPLTPRGVTCCEGRRWKLRRVWFRSVRFIRVQLLTASLPPAFSNIAGRQSCLHTMVSNAFPPFWCSVLENHATKIVFTITCHASPYARIERTQNKSSGRHSCSAERGKCVRPCGYH